jgi:hypothetical protein
MTPQPTRYFTLILIVVNVIFLATLGWWVWFTATNLKLMSQSKITSEPAATLNKAGYTQLLQNAQKP